MSAIIPAPPSAILPSDHRAGSDVARARLELSQARQQLVDQLHALETSLPTVPDWRKAIRLHPLLTLGGAFLTGWAIARLLTRRRDD